MDNDIANQVCRLAEETFGLETGAVKETALQPEIPQWDSVGHLNLMLAVESRFGTPVAFEEMIEINGIPALVEFLAARKSA